MTDKPVHRQIGIFAGLFSSADGTWIPMWQLRRMSATAVWMLFFGFVACGVIEAGLLKEFGILWVLLGALGFGLASYWFFLLIGGGVFGGERKPPEPKDVRELGSEG